MSGCRVRNCRLTRYAVGLAALLLAPLAQGAGAAPSPDSIREMLDDTLATTATRPESPGRAASTHAWLTRMQPRLAPFLADRAARVRLLERVHQEAALAGLSPEIVLAVIQVESAFKTDARSSAGAQGLIQIMPFWKNAIGRAHDDLFDTDLNLRYGCTILAHYLRIEAGDLTRALARYNGSLGQTWYPERVIRAWRKHWWLPSPVGNALP